MDVILGANGHVGSAVADALLAGARPVTVVLHDAARREAWQRRGAEVAIVDIHDPDALRQAFRRGTRAFLLNPPAAPATDTDVEERATVRSILRALTDSRLEKVVAGSTMGARPSDAIGDLGVLHELEQGLAAQPIPFVVVRAAFYMSNWDRALESARSDGAVPTMFPVDFRLPMVAPADLGRAAADLLSAPLDATGIRFVEGPQRYTSTDVADAFAAALRRPVTAVSTPRDRWEQVLASQGFSSAAARSYARMTGAVVDGPIDPPAPSTRGVTSLRDYIGRLVARPSS